MYHGNKKTKRDVQILSIVIFLAFYAGIIVRGRFWDAGLSKPTEPEVVEAQVGEEREILTVPSPTPTPVVLPDYFNDLTEVPVDALMKYELIKRYFGDDTYRAVRVAHCESRLIQWKRNTNKDGSVDVGMFQINQYWHGHRGDLTDIEENVRVAKEIYDEQGWNPWICYQLYSEGW